MVPRVLDMLDYVRLVVGIHHLHHEMYINSPLKKP